MLAKKIFSLLGLLFIGNRIGSVLADECNVENPINCISNAYYLVNKQNNSLITSDGGSGNLYYCSGVETKICEEQTRVGYYFVDQKTVYTCSIINGSLKCIKESIPDSRNACSVDNIGKLFMKTGDIIPSLCLNYVGGTASVVELNGSTKGNYLVYKNAKPTENIFGISGSNEKYAIVSIQDKIVNLNSTYTNNLKYVYVDTTKNRVMEKGDKDFPKSSGSTSEPNEDKIMELLCNNGGICKDSATEQTFSSFTGFTGAGIYILKIDAGTITKLDNTNIEASFDASKVHIYKCDAQVNCEKISGYAWNTTKTKIYKIPSEGNAQDISTDANTEHESSYCTGRLGLVYTDSTKHICMEDGFGVEIANNKYYIFGDTAMDASSPFLSMANKIFKMTDDYGIIDEDYKAENGKNYVVNTGTDDYAVYKYDASSTSFTLDKELSGAKNYIIHEDNVNIYDEYPLADTTLITTNDQMDKWTLYNCRDGKCKVTFGYLRSLNEQAKFFKFHSDNSKVVMMNTGFVDCKTPTTHDNGITSKGELCIKAHAENPILSSMTNGNIFAISISSANIFTRATGDHIIVRATDNSITYDNLYDEVGANLFKDQIKIETSGIDDSSSTTLGTLLLFKCESTGSCTKINGYARKSNKFYKFAAGVTSAVYTIPESVDCSANIGEVVTDGARNYLCINDGQKKVEITEATNYYALGSTSIAAGTFSGMASKMVKISKDFIVADQLTYPTNDDYVIKVGNEYKALTQSSNSFTLDDSKTTVVVYKQLDQSNVYSYIADPSTVITTPASLNGVILLDCAATGECQLTYGYYKAGDNYIIASHDGSLQLIADSDNSIQDAECKVAGDVGKLLKDNKLCVLNHATEASQKTYDLTTANGKKYLLANEESNIFAQAQTGSSIIVKGTTNSFTLALMEDFNVVGIDNTSKEVGAVDYTDATSQAKIAILKCSDNICGKVSGYTKSAAGNFYEIAATGGASVSSPAEDECGSSNVGKIILKGGTETVCLGNSSSVQVPTTGRYIVGTVGTGSKLANNKVIKFTNDYIVVDDSFEGEEDTGYLIPFGNNYYTYKYTANNKKFSLDSSVTGAIKTYQKVEAGANLLREVTSMNDIHLDDLPLLDLLQCNGGKCTDLVGYILVNGKSIYKCTNGNCNTPGGVDVEATCANAGKFTVKAAQGNIPANIQVCTGSGTTSIDILSTKTYFIGTSPKKYIGNSEKTIIALPTPDVGYFLVDGTNRELSSTGNTMIKCTEDGCVVDDSSVACSAGNVGKFFTSTKQLCLTEDGKKTAAISTSGSYLIHYGASSAFLNSIKSNSKYGVITVDGNSIKLDTSKTNVCVDNNTLAITDRTGSTCTGGKPFICSNTGLCIEGTEAPTITNKKIAACTTNIFRGEDFTTCNSSDTTIVSYCLNDSDGKIYPITGTTGSYACKAALSDKTLYVFKYTSDTNVVEVNLETMSINPEEAKNLIIYACNSSHAECTQTVGYAKVKVYSSTELTEEPDDFSTSTNYANYCKLDNGVCTVYGSNSFNTNAHVITLTSYMISKHGGEVVEDVTCAADKIGTFKKDTDGVCLGVESDGTTTVKTTFTGDFILTGTLESDSVFSYPDGSEAILVTASTYVIYYNNIQTDTTPIAYDTDTKKKVTLGSSFSDSALRLAIYECNSGNCIRTSGFVHDDSKYYSVPVSGPSVDITSSLVTTCEGNIGKLKSTGIFCNDEGDGKAIATGSGNYIIYDGAFKFARTIDNGVSISSISGTIADGLNIINVNKAKRFTLTSNAALLSEIGKISNLAIYYCSTGEKKICEITSGYLKTSDTTAVYYSLKPVTSKSQNNNAKLNSETLAENECDAAGKVGLLFDSTIKLCLKEDESGISFASKKTYNLNNAGAIAAENAFTGAASTSINEMIEVNTNYMVVNPLYYKTLSEGIHAFSIGTESHEIMEIDISSDTPTITEADLSSIHLYGCNEKQCVQTYGYIYNGSNAAYAIKNGESNGNVECAANCNTIGTLYTGFKLCITTTYGEAEPFSTSGTGYYIVNVPGNNVFTKTEKNSIIVKKVKNAFVLNNFEVVDGKNYIVNSLLYSYASGTTIMTKSSTPTILVAKKVNDSNNFLVEADLGGVKSKDDLTGIDIYSCDGTGACSKKNGYVVAGTGVDKKIYENYSTPGTWKDVTTSETCTTAADHAGGVKISDSSKIQLCMPASAGVASFNDVVNTNTYLFGKDEESYKIYNGNGSTSTIVIVGDPVVGYYMTTVAGVIEVGSETKSNELLIKCTGGEGISCETVKGTGEITVSEAGYYLNAANNKSLILCTNVSTPNCQLKSGNDDVQDKSYIGNSGILISCDNSKVCSNPTTASGNKYVVNVDTDVYKIYASDGTKLTLVQSASIETYNQDATYTTLFKLVDLTSNDPTELTKLFDCDVNGSCKETYGYYMPTANRFLKISNAPEENAVVADNISSCAAIGDLLSNGKLCAKDSGTEGIAMPAVATNYIIGEVAAGNIFTKSGDTHIILKATSKSFTLDLDNDSDTDYCKDASNVATLKEEDEECSSETGCGVGCCGADGTCTAVACGP